MPFVRSGRTILTDLEISLNFKTMETKRANLVQRLAGAIWRWAYKRKAQRRKTEIMKIRDELMRERGIIIVQ